MKDELDSARAIIGSGLINLSIWTVIIAFVLFLPKEAKAHEAKYKGVLIVHSHVEALPPEHRHKDYRWSVMFGTGDTAGAIKLGVEEVLKGGRYSIGVDWWNDGNDRDAGNVDQIRKTRPKETNVLPVKNVEEDPGNVCIHGARNWYPKGVRLTAGLAYCAEDQGDIDNHLQGLLGAAYKLPKNLVCYDVTGRHYTDNATFVGCSRRF